MANAWKLFIALVIFAGIALASNYRTTEMQQYTSNWPCIFKNFMSNSLPTIALLILFSAAFVLFVGLIVMNEWVHQYNKKNPKEKLRLKDFMHLPLAMKVVAIVFILLAILLFIGGVIALISALMAPEILKSLVGMSPGMNATANC